MLFLFLVFCNVELLVDLICAKSVRVSFRTKTSPTTVTLSCALAGMLSHKNKKITATLRKYQICVLSMSQIEVRNAIMVWAITVLVTMPLLVRHRVLSNRSHAAAMKILAASELRRDKLVLCF